MALSGFKYTISWSTDFDGLDSRRDPKIDAFTSAPFTTGKKLQEFKSSDDSLYRFQTDSIDIQIKMDNKKSWVFKNAESDSLLKHEQLHYNVSALAGRDLERGLKKLSAASAKDLYDQAKSLLSSLQTLVTQVNAEYDDNKLSGSNHGNDAGNQTKWEMHINKLMNDPNGELKGINASTTTATP
jgi:hypothetical protein